VRIPGKGFAITAMPDDLKADDMDPITLWLYCL